MAHNYLLLLSLIMCFLYDPTHQNEQITNNPNKRVQNIQGNVDNLMGKFLFSNQSYNIIDIITKSMEKENNRKLFNWLLSSQGLKLLGKKSNKNNINNKLLKILLADSNNLQNIMEFLPILFDIFNIINHPELLPRLFEKIYSKINDKYLNKSLPSTIPQFLNIIENNETVKMMFVEEISTKFILPIILDKSKWKTYGTILNLGLHLAVHKNNDPESIFYNRGKSADSIFAAINHFTEFVGTTKIVSDQFLGAVEDNLMEILKFTDTYAQTSKQLLVEVINDAIEPMVKVNAAYKLAKKNRGCDRYIMCLLSQHTDQTSNSVLKYYLSKYTTLMLSWYLSGRNDTSLLAFYPYIFNGSEDKCNDFYTESCSSVQLDGEKQNVEHEDHVHEEL